MARNVVATTARVTTKAARVRGAGATSYEDDEDEGHDGIFPEGGGRRWSSSSGEGTQQSNAKATSTGRNMVATTARATTKAARSTMATAATATTVTTMTPNGDKDNEDGNSKNNDKATTTLTATIEGDEHCQSRRDNRGSRHRLPWDAAIALTAASSRHAFIGVVSR